MPHIWGLTEQWRIHDIERRYHALLSGIIPEDRGTIDAPIGRHPRDRKKVAVETKNGPRNAITHYRVLERLPFANCTYTEMTLETRDGPIRFVFIWLISGIPLLEIRPMVGENKNTIWPDKLFMPRF